jgi:hypothetical protein
VAVFYKNSNDPNAVYEFVGKGNFNLDKATHEPFGFISDPKAIPDSIDDSTFGWDENNNENLILGTTPITEEYSEPIYVSAEE